jgi:hypothetical protein
MGNLAAFMNWSTPSVISWAASAFLWLGIFSLATAIGKEMWKNAFANSKTGESALGSGSTGSKTGKSDWSSGSYGWSSGKSRSMSAPKISEAKSA